MGTADGDSTESVSPALAGRCLCETVRVEIDRPLLGALYCHCKRCQRRTGSAFSVTALTEPGSMHVTAGDEAIRVWDPRDGGWIKAFCGLCGSQVYATNPDRPELRGVRMGVLDEDPGIRPSAHQFTDYAPPWEPIPDDGLPRFRERLPTERWPTE